MKVTSLREALIWFIDNGPGTVTCVHLSTGNEEKCDSYPKALEFYKYKNK